MCMKDIFLKLWIIRFEEVQAHAAAIVHKIIRRFYWTNSTLFPINMIPSVFRGRHDIDSASSSDEEFNSPRGPLLSNTSHRYGSVSPHNTAVTNNTNREAFRPTRQRRIGLFLLLLCHFCTWTYGCAVVIWLPRMIKLKWVLRLIYMYPAQTIGQKYIVSKCDVSYLRSYLGWGNCNIRDDDSSNGFLVSP